MMRNTIHLVTARDCIALRSLFSPVLERGLQSSPFGRNLVGMEIQLLIRHAMRLMKPKPRTLAEMGALLHERWPDRDATSLAYAIRHLVALVQVPPRGVWGKSAQATWTSAELWLGRPLARKPSIDALILRYLAAFGPATVADMSTWSGLTALRCRSLHPAQPVLLAFPTRSRRRRPSTASPCPVRPARATTMARVAPSTMMRRPIWRCSACGRHSPPAP